METIRVNMTPCEDVQTIHASQNDNEAREWGFELHNNGEKIDSSSISDQMVFKAYEGGTEEILPTNGSTPTTSPFLGDIRYPQGLLTDQEFLYRESPTERDGNAKIQAIYGNTLKWNQLVQNGNFVDSSNWGARQSTFTVSDNIATVTPLTEGTERGMLSSSFPVKANHKYLLSCEIKPPIQSTARVSFGGGINYGFDVTIQASQWNKCQGIVLNDTDRNIGYYSLIRNSLTPSQTIQFKNMMVIDLTQMFGSGNEPTTVSVFETWLSNNIGLLPYYDYNQGTLLSFNGEQIKTVGFNQWDEQWETGGVSGTNGNIYNDSSRIRSKNYISVFPNMTYYIKAPRVFNYAWYDGNKQYISGDNSASPNYTRTSPNGAQYLKFSTTGTTYNNDICINISDPERNGTYEPYTESIADLPISQYFPNGMDGVGTDYDELTNTKATTRMTRVDLGSLTWNRSAINEGYAFVSGEITDMKPVGNVITANVLCPFYTLYMSGNGYSMPNDKTYRVGGSYFGRQRVIIRDDTYTDATAFKTAMSGVYLVYPLATPIETSFTTASLVTENSEIPLSNEDDVLIGKCTEELSAQPGFIDAKIKLTDGDGTCYSNKIQLHVERKP